ncbi:hypothetical protein [Roseinatronobacter sp. NSM]|uniref:hypothetical protein n=1 Tax=Roseinatronobacter sp. NSM TaxID=3457785 RepID=UPI0040362101
MSLVDSMLSAEERFGRVRETVAQLRKPACTGFARTHLSRRLIDDLAHLEEIGALESVAEVLGVAFGGRV